MKTIALLLCLALPVAGCAAVVSSLPVILAYAADAQIILSTVEAFANQFFQLKPMPDLQKKVAAAVSRARMALDGVVRAAAGTQKLDQAKVDEAFAEFKFAYLDLVNLVEPFGVSMAGDRMKVAPGKLVVPQPLALRP